MIMQLRMMTKDEGSLHLSIDVRVRSSHLFASIGVVQLPWMGILSKSQSPIGLDNIEAL